MKKISSTIFALFFIFSATACAVDFNDSSDCVIHVPPSLKVIETEIFAPTQASDLNKEKFISTFRETKTELSEEEFTQKYTAFYNYMPLEYSREYNVDAFEVQQNDGNSIFYVWQSNTLYRIDPFATDTGSSFNGFVQFSISDLNKDGASELLVSYYYDGARINMSRVHAIDMHSGKHVRFNRYDNQAIFFKQTENGIGLYKGKENEPTTATELVSEVTKNTRRYNFHQLQFTVWTTDYKAEVEIDENTINFPIVAEDLPLQFTSRVKMIWLGESFAYTNSDTYLNCAFANYSNGIHTLECEPWGAGDAITDFYIANGMEIKDEYYMYRVNELDCLGDYDATISYRFSEEKPVVKNVFSIIEI